MDSVPEHPNKASISIKTSPNLFGVQLVKKKKSVKHNKVKINKTRYVKLIYQYTTVLPLDYNGADKFLSPSHVVCDNK